LRARRAWPQARPLARLPDGELAIAVHAPTFGYLRSEGRWPRRRSALRRGVDWEQADGRRLRATGARSVPVRFRSADLRPADPRVVPAEASRRGEVSGPGIAEGADRP